MSIIIRAVRKIRYLVYKMLRRNPNIDRRSIIKRRVILDNTTRVGPWVVIDGEGGEVVIGTNCSVNAHCWIGAGLSRVSIGDDVRVGSGVKISCAAHNFDDVTKTIREQGLRRGVDIIIENDVWIGMNASICPGVRIGQGSVIGAGAVVVSDIPPMAVAVGVPAKVIKYR